MPAPRNVLLNALYLAPGASGGPETYLRGLAPALARDFPDLRLTVATTPRGAAALRADGWEQFVALLTLPCEDGQRVRRQWAEQVLLPRAARRAGAEIVHSLASVAPVYAGARSVVTLHDVTFLLRPTFGRLTTWGMGLVVGAAARRADALIAGTAAARDEICSVLGLDAARFSVVHHGHEPTRAAHPTPAKEIRSRYALGDSRVVLCVAAKPHQPAHHRPGQRLVSHEVRYRLPLLTLAFVHVHEPHTKHAGTIRVQFEGAPLGERRPTTTISEKPAPANASPHELRTPHLQGPSTTHLVLERSIRAR